MRYFFRVEYDGTRFCGWQNQPTGDSVQQLIEEALTVALRAPCSIVGAGRTDAGVHARAQGAHFDVSEKIDAPRLTASVNALLPHDIAVYGMTPVSSDFHARFSAEARLYKYYMALRKNPLNRQKSWVIDYPVNWDKVDSEVENFGGQYDFTTFCSAGSDTKSMVCDIKLADLSRDGDAVIFTIKANRFIYKMVRSIVGTLIDIGRGKIDDTLSAIIASKDRNRAGDTAPARGLVLENVFYP